MCLLLEMRRRGALFSTLACKVLDGTILLQLIPQAAKACPALPGLVVALWFACIVFLTACPTAWRLIHVASCSFCDTQGGVRLLVSSEG